MAHHEVIVGNIGTVCASDRRKDAERIFDDYCIQSRRKIGRAAGEEVVWMIDGEIHRENSTPHLRVVKNPPVYWAESGWVETKSAAKKVSQKTKIPKGCRYVPVGTSGKFVIECTDKDAGCSVKANGSANKIAMVGARKNGSEKLEFDKVDDSYFVYHKGTKVGQIDIDRTGKIKVFNARFKSRPSKTFKILQEAKDFITKACHNEGSITGNPSNKPSSDTHYLISETGEYDSFASSRSAVEKRYSLEVDDCVSAVVLTKAEFDKCAKKKGKERFACACKIVMHRGVKSGVVSNPFGFGKAKQQTVPTVYAKPAKTGQSIKTPDEYGISDLMVDSRARHNEANYNVHIFHPKSQAARDLLLNDDRWIVVDGPVRLTANPRNVTNEIVKAFRARKSKTIDNTKTDGDSIWLFTKKIVERRETGVFITTAGHNTKTTKDILAPFAEVKVKAGNLYCNGEPWSGGWKKVGSI